MLLGGGIGQSSGGHDGNAPTVASEFGLWGFRRVYSSQLPNDRTIGDARVHLTVNSTVNAPDSPVDTDGWGVCRLTETATVHWACVPGRLPGIIRSAAHHHVGGASVAAPAARFFNVFLPPYT